MTTLEHTASTTQMLTAVKTTNLTSVPKVVTSPQNAHYIMVITPPTAMDVKFSKICSNFGNNNHQPSRKN